MSVILTSAQTVTELTKQAAWLDDFGDAPDVAQALEAARRSARDKLAEETQRRQRRGETEPSDWEKHAKRVADNFEDALKKLPADWRIVPVLYTRIEKLDNADVWTEFNLEVQPRFLKWLAETRAEELRAMGICDFGIGRMKFGLFPCDEQGNYYPVSIDHLIERSGSGKMGMTRGKDPLAPADMPETCQVNWFSNLYLVSTKLHAVKNAINEPQDLSRRLSPGDSGYGVMALPVRDPENPKFCHTGKEFSIKPHKDNDPYWIMTLAGFTVDLACHRLRQLYKNDTARRACVAFNRRAQAEGKTPDALARESHEARKKFCDSLAANSETKKLYAELRPVVREALALLKKAHEAAGERFRHTRNPELRRFAHIYDGSSKDNFYYSAWDLRRLIAALPLSEYQAAAAEFDAMEQAIAKNNVLNIRLVTVKPPKRDFGRKPDRKAEKPYAQNPHHPVPGRGGRPRRQGR